MRSGIKFLALTGLSGLVFTCLIAWAGDYPKPKPGGVDLFGFSPAIPQPQPPTSEPPHQYRRTQEQVWPAQTEPTVPPEASRPTPAQPLFSFDDGLPEEAAAPSPNPAVLNQDLIRSEYKEANSVSKTAANELMGDNPPTSTPPVVSETVELFSETPLPEVSADETLITPEPIPVQPVDAAPLAPAVPSKEPVPDITVEPTNGPQTAVLTLEWIKRTEVNVGQACQCDLVVKNAGDIPAHNVAVRANFPSTARLLPATQPAPTPSGNSLKWVIGEVGPRQSKTIQIHMIPTQRGDLNAAAFVEFTSAAATAFRVQEPLLNVVLQGPKEVQVGDPASQIIQVSNPGTGTARNVEIKALIPAGLEHPQGKQLTMAIGSLNPGETRMVRLALSAVSGGKHPIKVLAEAKLTSEAAPYLRKLVESEIRIIAPSVLVQVEGPGLRYKNRNATYQITTMNDGTAVSNNVRVMHKLPDGFSFVSATEGGKYDAQSKTVAWFVGRIEPGQSSTMSVTLEATKLGDFAHQVSAITDQGARSEDTLPTRVEGIASLALEVKDVNDPVEVGVETAYEIHVKNHGTKHAQNVAVACELPADVELVDVNAPAKHNLQGRVVVFQALPTLDPEKSAVFRIIVRGKVDGYQRFRARLASDSIQEPLIVEELTKFYGE